MKVVQLRIYIDLILIARYSLNVSPKHFVRRVAYETHVRSTNIPIVLSTSHRSIDNRPLNVPGNVLQNKKRNQTFIH